MKTNNLKSALYHCARVMRTQKQQYSVPPQVEPQAPQAAVPPKRVTIPSMMKKYKENQPLTMVTCYDFTCARLIDDVGIDMALVGDSVGQVVLGHSSTIPVTVDEMVHHSAAVSRGCRSLFKVGDMPFGSYEVSDQDAVRNAIRLVKEGGMDSVKLEGGRRIASQVAAIVRAGIPTIGHIGLTPQTLSQLGGYRVQGKNVAEAVNLLQDAMSLQEAGAFAIVIECVPVNLATYITKKLRIPTIGIGSGGGTSGQVLVLHDILGLYSKPPKFSKQYANVSQVIQQAVQQYRAEVTQKQFPAREHMPCDMQPAEFDHFLSTVEQKQ